MDISIISILIIFILYFYYFKSLSFYNICDVIDELIIH